MRSREPGIEQSFHLPPLKISQGEEISSDRVHEFPDTMAWKCFGTLGSQDVLKEHKAETAIVLNVMEQTYPQSVPRLHERIFRINLFPPPSKIIG